MTLFIILITLIILIYIIGALIFIIYYSMKKPSTNTDVLIVLGCKVKDNKPSNSLKRRLDASYKFLKNHKNTYCVVSGGKGSDELISEAECMYRYLIQKGISSNRIIKEDKSTNTCENLAYSFKIIKACYPQSNITIATDFYHHFRANIIAKKQHIKISGAVSSIPPIKTFIFNTLRELIAIPYQIIKPNL